MRRLARLLLISTLLLGTGGHWALIQSAAWTGMIVGRMHQGSSINEALSQTFDGQHPCDLCKLVERHAGENDGKSSKTPPGIKKLELFVEAAVSPALEASYRTVAAMLSDSAHGIQRAYAPAVPPPRAA
jgi:hypothetical protein